MNLRHFLLFCMLFLIAALQVWATGILLLTRQTEMLLLCSIGIAVFWAWCGWGLWLRRRYAATAFASAFFAATLLLAALALFAWLDGSDIFLRLA